MWTVVYDRHNAYDATNFRYVAPVSGVYHFSISLHAGTISDGFRKSLRYRVNGAGSVPYIGQITSHSTSPFGEDRLNGAFDVSLRAGDFVEIHFESTSPTTINGSSEATHFQVHRLSGPAAIAATETVTCRTVGSTQLIAGAGTTTVINPAKTFDSHGSYNTSNGLFTVPSSGRYEIKAALRFTANTYGSNQTTELYALKNGSQYSIMDRRIPISGISTLAFLSGSDIVQCLAGDTLAVAALNVNGGSGQNLDGSVYVTFTRIGN